MTEEDERSSMGKKSPACLLQWEGEKQDGPAKSRPRQPPGLQPEGQTRVGARGGRGKGSRPPPAARPLSDARASRGGGSPASSEEKTNPRPPGPDESKRNARAMYPTLFHRGDF